MTVVLTRRHAALLLAVAAWTAISFLNFAGQLWEAWSAGEERPEGYWVAHSVLVVVNLAIAAVLARLGWRAWRAHADHADDAEDADHGERTDHGEHTDRRDHAAP